MQCEEVWLVSTGGIPLAKLFRRRRSIPGLGMEEARDDLKRKS